MLMGFMFSLACAAFLASPASAAVLRPMILANRPSPRNARSAQDPEVSSRYLELIKTLESRGASFSDIFGSLCAAAIAHSEEPALEKARDIFGSLYHWTDSGGRPVFQEREDLALHLIYGGLFEAYQGPGQGEAAGRAKEERDAETPGNSYDLDDLSATLMGAYWVATAQTSPEEFSKILSHWADGRKTLNRLPITRFGRLPPRRVAGEEQLTQVRRFAHDALAD